jgi:hypothetical protein
LTIAPRALVYFSLLIINMLIRRTLFGKQWAYCNSFKVKLMGENQEKQVTKLTPFALALLDDKMIK